MAPIKALEDEVRLPLIEWYDISATGCSGISTATIASFIIGE